MPVGVAFPRARIQILARWGAETACPLWRVGPVQDWPAAVARGWFARVVFAYEAPAGPGCAGAQCCGAAGYRELDTGREVVRGGVVLSPILPAGEPTIGGNIGATQVVPTASSMA